MTSTEPNKPHQKHTSTARPALGQFGRNELAILGAPCGKIKELAYRLVSQLAPSWKVAYVDADHQGADAERETGPAPDTAMAFGASLEYTDKITGRRLDFRQDFNEFQRRAFFNAQDLVLVNGNHFRAHNQIVILDPAKPLEKKLDRLTNVGLILLTDPETSLPEYLRRHLPHLDQIPVLLLNEVDRVAEFAMNFLNNRVPPLRGLVLAGGKSTRMQRDKGALAYHGLSQREHVHRLLTPFCEEVAVSCNREQMAELAGGLPLLEDRFLNMGPLGGILTALQTNPDAAWLTVACDLPYLSEQTLHYLVQHRNPSQMATAFRDPTGEFPEPLLTIWEPRSYPVLLQFLSQGYSCPRKALINSEVELLQVPDAKELMNVNYPEEYRQAMQELGS